MRILVTRPEPDASKQADVLRHRGLIPLIAPLLSVELLPLGPEIADRYDAFVAAIATSRNALRSLERHGVPIALKPTPLFCVGPATAAMARSLGFADVIEGDGTAKDITHALATNVDVAAGPILRLTGETPSPAPEQLDEALRAAGYTVASAISYRVEPQPRFTSEVRAHLQSGEIDLVILMSPLTASTYRKACNDSALTLRSDKPSYLCLSQSVADILVDVPTSRIFIADKPNQSALLSVIDQAVAQLP